MDLWTWLFILLLWKDDWVIPSKSFHAWDLSKELASFEAQAQREGMSVTESKCGEAPWHPIQQSWQRGDMLQSACLTPVGLKRVFMHKRYTDHVYEYYIYLILLACVWDSVKDDHCHLPSLEGRNLQLEPWSWGKLADRHWTQPRPSSTCSSVSFHWCHCPQHVGSLWSVYGDSHVNKRTTSDVDVSTGAKWEEMGKVFDAASNNAHTDAHGNCLCLRFLVF